MSYALDAFDQAIIDNAVQRWRAATPQERADIERWAHTHLNNAARDIAHAERRAALNEAVLYAIEAVR